MAQGLRRAAKIFPHKTAPISKTVEITWAGFQDRVARLAGALHGLAMKTEDRVAMLSSNSHRYAEYYYGVFWAGANVIPMNIRWSLAEHIYSIKDSGARFLIVDDAFAEIGAEATRPIAENAGVTLVDFITGGGIVVPSLFFLSKSFLIES